MARRPVTLASFTALSDGALLRRYRELAYHELECLMDPDHPASRANGARWKRELRLATRALELRGAFADQDVDVFAEAQAEDERLSSLASDEEAS